MTESVPSGQSVPDANPLPDLHALIRAADWRRALAVSRLGQHPVEVQEGLGAVLGMQEAIRAKRWPAARKYLKEYQGALQHSTQGELSVLRRQLDPAALEVALGALVAGQNEPDPALLAEVLTPALNLPLTRAEALNVQGVQHMLRSEPELADGFFRQAVQADPGHYRALTNVGNVQLEAGQFQQAEATYREVLKVAPDYDGAHHNLGVALRRQGKVAESVGAIRRGQRLGMKRSREDTDAEMKEQFGRIPLLRHLRWLVLALVALLFYVALRASGGT